MERDPAQVPPPGDPAGIDEPHDVLAAEEFPLPAPDSRATASRARQRLRALDGRSRTAWTALLVGAVALGAGALARGKKLRG